MYSRGRGGSKLDNDIKKAKETVTDRDNTNLNPMINEGIKSSIKKNGPTN